MYLPNFPFLRLLIPLIILSITSCRSVLYVPTPQNVPLFEEQGELKISGSYSASDETEIIGLQTAFAASSNLAIAANYNYINGSYDDYVIGHAHAGELLLGYYKNFAKYFIFESFIGYSHSQVNKLEHFWTKSYEVNNIFIQPAIGSKLLPVELALSARLCRNSFVNYNSFYLYPTSRTTGSENPFDNNSIQYMLEPALTVRLNNEWFAIQYQFGASINLYDTDFIQDHFYMGITAIIKLNLKGLQSDKN